MIGWIIFGVVVLLIVALVAYFISVYNKLVKLLNITEESFSTMDVYMKKRYDLIPNLVETVKGYTKHESETLEKVIQARNLAMTSTTMEDKIKNENALSGTLKSLFALTEAYPDLKANANFADLQGQLAGIEEDIANSRKYYNATVRNYNNVVDMFPSNIVAGMFKFTRKLMFEVSYESERENVKVQF